MDIYEAFLQVLNSNDPLKNLVGTRIFPDELPEEEDDPEDPDKKIPIINGVTYQELPNGVDYTLKGKSIIREIYQFDCWGRTNVEAKEIYKALVSALDSFRGVYGNLNVQFSQQMTTAQKFHYPYNADKPDIIQHRYSTDYKFHYTK